MNIHREPIINGGCAAKELPINWISSDDIFTCNFLYIQYTTF